MKQILDVCCGSRMFYYDKQNENTIYGDCREHESILSDGRKLVVKPEIIFDFKNLPFEDEVFNLVIFDPPHLSQGGEKSWLVQKYGKLNKDTWQEDIKQGFEECFRVLKQNGTLVFKWNEEQILFSEVIKLAPQMPLLGDKRGRTRWTVFYKSLGGE